MDIEEIKAMPVAEIADVNAILWLGRPTPQLQKPAFLKPRVLTL
jgi:N6-adenosine-specific RNA methylase IME4